MFSSPASVETKLFFGLKISRLHYYRPLHPFNKCQQWLFFHGTIGENNIDLGKPVQTFHDYWNILFASLSEKLLNKDFCYF